MLIYSDVPVFTARFDAIEESYDGPDITYFFDAEVPMPPIEFSVNEMQACAYGSVLSAFCHDQSRLS